MRASLGSLARGGLSLGRLAARRRIDAQAGSTATGEPVMRRKDDIHGSRNGMRRRFRRRRSSLLVLRAASGRG